MFVIRGEELQSKKGSLSDIGELAKHDNPNLARPIEDQVSFLDENRRLNGDIIVYKTEKSRTIPQSTRELLYILFNKFRNRRIQLTQFEGEGGFASVHSIHNFNPERIQSNGNCWKFPINPLGDINWAYLRTEIPRITNSPNCVRVNGVWRVTDLATETNTSYNVQDIEFINKFRNLHMILNDPNDPRNNPQEIFAIIRTAAIEINRLHEAGAIHRDISPNNIVVLKSRETTRIKINDFDLATKIGSRRPEQAHGKLYYINLHAISEKGPLEMNQSYDYYAIGISLAELLFFDRNELITGSKSNNSKIDLFKLQKKRTELKDRIVSIIRFYSEFYDEAAKELIEIITGLISPNVDEQEKAFEKLLSEETNEIMMKDLPTETFQVLKDEHDQSKTRRMKVSPHTPRRTDANGDNIMEETVLM